MTGDTIMESIPTIHFLALHGLDASMNKPSYISRRHKDYSRLLIAILLSVWVFIHLINQIFAHIYFHSGGAGLLSVCTLVEHYGGL